MKMARFVVFYILTGLGAERSVRFRGRVPAQEFMGEAESFEAILHLKEDTKLVQTLMQSKYCALLQSTGVRIGGPKYMVPPNFLIRGCSAPRPLRH